MATIKQIIDNTKHRGISFTPDNVIDIKLVGVGDYAEDDEGILYAKVTGVKFIGHYYQHGYPSTTRELYPLNNGKYLKSKCNKTL